MFLGWPDWSVLVTIMMAGSRSLKQVMAVRLVGQSVMSVGRADK